MISLKIIQSQVNLLPLIHTIKKRYQIRTVSALFNEEKYLNDIWYKEIENCLNTFSKEINDNEDLNFKIQEYRIKK